MKGTTEFKALVYVAAQERGLVVEGYAPKPGEKAAVEIAARPSPATPGAAPATPEAREKPAPVLEGQPSAQADPYRGEVRTYGPAPFQHRPEGSPSFRVTLRSDDGSEHTHWGVGLEDAMARSGAKTGDRVVLERGRKAPVEIPAADGGTRTVQRQEWQARLLSAPGAERQAAPTPTSHKAHAAAYGTPAQGQPTATGPTADSDLARRAMREAINDKVSDPVARERAWKSAQEHLAKMRESLGQRSRAATPSANEIAPGRQRAAREDRER